MISLNMTLTTSRWKEFYAGTLRRLQPGITLVSRVLTVQRSSLWLELKPPHTTFLKCSSSALAECVSKLTIQFVSKEFCGRIRSSCASILSEFIGKKSEPKAARRPATSRAIIEFVKQRNLEQDSKQQLFSPLSERFRLLFTER